jgi:hypothetical protein
MAGTVGNVSLAVKRHCPDIGTLALAQHWRIGDGQHRNICKLGPPSFFLFLVHMRELTLEFEQSSLEFTV